MDLIYRGAAGTIIACSGSGPWNGLPGCATKLRSGFNGVIISEKVLFFVPPDPRFEMALDDPRMDLPGRAVI